MRVSIVIPAYNGERTLGECIAACMGQTWPDIEVIVVDDGSTDGTGTIAGAYGVRYVRRENAGPAAARNCGARLATGEIVAFTDADCVPERDWIEQLIEGFSADEVVGVGGTYGIANPENKLARLIHEEIRMRHERFGETVDFLGSFNVAYRKREFDAVGGFDKTFRIASAEDNDLAYRLIDAGGVLRFVPGAIVKHYHPERLWPYLKTQMRHGYWRMKLYAKHPKRVGGDHYAGRGELMRPVLLLAFVGFVPFVIWGSIANRWLFAGSFGAWCTVGLLIVLSGVGRQAPLAIRAGVRPKWCGTVMSWRDFARGLGLVRGVWRFLVLRRGTA